MNCQIVTTRSDVATITRTPGHHQAQNPAKEAHSGPSAVCGHTKSAPGPSIAAGSPARSGVFVTLVTCAGSFDATTRHYRSDIVVYSDWITRS
jgi:hypothetical protein